jgi:hypothetical protein
MAISKGAPASKKVALSQLGGDEDKAVVVKEEHTTTSYVTDKPQDTSENKANEFQNPTEIRADNYRNTAPVFQTAQPNKNRLADFFAELKDYETEENETFYLMVTRKSDLMTDTFNKPCLGNVTFPPLQINASMMFQFIPLLQKYNGNSGGRFDVVVCDATGGQLEDIGLNGFVISNPLEDSLKDTSAKENGIDVIQLFEKINEANERRAQESERRFTELLAAMRPQEDEFVKLAKEKLRNDILNPKETEKFNPEKILESVFTTTAVMQGMGEGFAKMFNRDGNSSGEKDKGMLETLLTNEMFIDRASDFASNFMETLGSVAVAMTGKAPVVNPNFQQPQQPDTGGVPHQIPQPQQQTQEQIMQEQERKELIKSIIVELEGDKPLDAENEFLIKLKAEHTDIYTLLKVACMMQPFEALVDQLETIVPDEFDSYYDGDELNVKGLYVNERLKTFYDFMKVAP